MSAKKSAIVAVIVVTLILAAVIVRYIKSPKPEIIDATQTWASSYTGNRPTYIDVNVKNNGEGGQVAVHIEYQIDFDKNGEKSQEIYLSRGENKTVRFTLYQTHPDYLFPLLIRAYAD
jgi:hypothetical protein